MIDSDVSPDADDLSGAGSLRETFTSPVFTNTTSDDLIVTLLSTGLAAIKANRVRREADRGVISTRRLSRSELLPAPWRAGFARLWWRFQQAGLTAPEDDLSVFELCRTPFVEWELQLELSDTDREARLLDGDELSELAREAAKLGVRDVEADSSRSRASRCSRRWPR